MEAIYSLGDVARILRVQGYKIAYAITTGVLPEASGRLANKRCFTMEDVQRIARHFGVESTTVPGNMEAKGRA